MKKFVAFPKAPLTLEEEEIKAREAEQATKKAPTSPPVGLPEGKSLVSPTEAGDGAAEDGDELN